MQIFLQTEDEDLPFTVLFQWYYRKLTWLKYFIHKSRYLFISTNMLVLSKWNILFTRDDSFCQRNIWKLCTSTSITLLSSNSKIFNFSCQKLFSSLEVAFLWMEILDYFPLQMVWISISSIWFKYQLLPTNGMQLSSRQKMKISWLWLNGNRCWVTNIFIYVTEKMNNL